MGLIGYGGCVSCGQMNWRVMLMQMTWNDSAQGAGEHPGK